MQVKSVKTNFLHFSQHFSTGLLTLIVIAGLAAFLSFLPQTAAAIYEPEPGLVEVEFSFESAAELGPEVEYEKVYLAAQFNDWNPTGTLMEDEEGDGVYRVTVYLEPGEYEYKFVLDGQDWITPDEADDYAPDGFGGQNAVIRVGEDAHLPDDPGERGDGEITVDMLNHNYQDHRYFNPLSEEEVSFRFQTRGQDVEEVLVKIVTAEGEELSRSLSSFLFQGPYEYYRRIVEIPVPEFSYYFEIRDGGERHYYGAEGETARYQDLNYFQIDLSTRDIFTTPDWARDAVFYQIFPDRFAKGTSGNDPEFIEIYRNRENREEALIPEWHQGIRPADDPVLQEEHLSDEDPSIHPQAGYYAFYGGDLFGVEEKIPYLKELGINTIYFNPIFKASAYHRYNTAGFELIDDTLAYRGEQEKSREYFAELVEKLEDNGIRVILDGVFNHVGFEHWAFQDVVEKEEESEYLDWFNIHDFPVLHLYDQQQEELPPNYDGWWDFGHMPELNLDNPEVRDYIWEITEQWMDKGIAGWRLDVPTDVRASDPEFWRDWREHVKSLDSEAYLSGEIWGDARDFLEGDEFDAVMNYRFRDAVNSFIGQGRSTADEFHHEMMRLLFDYPEQAVYALQNLLGSHDTMRYLTMIDGDRDRFKLSKLLKFTYFGAPMIYYGDEIGMEGGDDPDNRRTMVWEERDYFSPDEELLSYVQELIALRNQEAALRRGELTRIATGDQLVYGFLREHEEERLLVVINAGDETTITLDWAELKAADYQIIFNDVEIDLDETTGEMELEMPVLEGTVLRLLHRE